LELADFKDLEREKIESFETLVSLEGEIRSRGVWKPEDEYVVG
jgi:hypothetical protein|tara:strand:+ start:85 stop:213 length:129 start_codon:yes stop_codon:yes gene_type:complete